MAVLVIPLMVPQRALGQSWERAFFISPSGELLSRPRYRGRTHFRAVHGDQFGYHGDRPDQANRDHDCDSDP
jgi:hypothetical protein